MPPVDPERPCHNSSAHHFDQFFLGLIDTLHVAKVHPGILLYEKLGMARAGIRQRAERPAMSS
jgi:hypothetical protein